MIYVKIMFNLISCILPISLCNVIILHAFNGCHSIVRRNYFFNSRGSLKYPSINFHFKPALPFSCDSSKANYNWSWIYQSCFIVLVQQKTLLVSEAYFQLSSHLLWLAWRRNDFLDFYWPSASVEICSKIY